MVTVPTLAKFQVVVAVYPVPQERAHLMNHVTWQGRHPATQHFESLFEFGHLPEPLQLVSGQFWSLATALLEQLHDGPELSACLRKLVEAKDCAVRQMVKDKTHDAD